MMLAIGRKNAESSRDFDDENPPDPAMWSAPFRNRWRVRHENSLDSGGNARVCCDVCAGKRAGNHAAARQSDHAEFRRRRARRDTGLFRFG